MDANAFDKKLWQQEMAMLIAGSRKLDLMKEVVDRQVGILIGIIQEGTHSHAPGTREEMVEPGTYRRWIFEILPQRTGFGKQKLDLHFTLCQDGMGRESPILYTTKEGKEGPFRMKHGDVVKVYDSLPFLTYFVSQLVVNLREFMEPYREAAQR